MFSVSIIIVLMTLAVLTAAHGFISTSEKVNWQFNKEKLIDGQSKLYQIDDGVCDRVLKLQDYGCVYKIPNYETFLTPSAVRITVDDPNAFAEIVISDDLALATVIRTGGCRDTASVSVMSNCDGILGLAPVDIDGQDNSSRTQSQIHPKRNSIFTVVSPTQVQIETHVIGIGYGKGNLLNGGKPIETETLILNGDNPQNEAIMKMIIGLESQLSDDDKNNQPVNQDVTNVVKFLLQLSGNGNIKLHSNSDYTNNVKLLPQLSHDGHNKLPSNTDLTNLKEILPQLGHDGHDKLPSSDGSINFEEVLSQLSGKGNNNKVPSNVDSTDVLKLLPHLSNDNNYKDNSAELFNNKQNWNGNNQQPIHIDYTRLIEKLKKDKSKSHSNNLYLNGKTQQTQGADLLELLSQVEAQSNNSNEVFFKNDDENLYETLRPDSVVVSQDVGTNSDQNDNSGSYNPGSLLSVYENAVNNHKQTQAPYNRPLVYTFI